MGEWFQERYISRDEHQQIVAYYKKLVAHLHCSVRDLRAEAVSRPAAAEAPPSVEKHQSMPPQGRHGDNVIRFDFRRRH